MANTTTFEGTVQQLAPLDSLPGPGATLVVIDCQRGFDQCELWGGNRNNPHESSNGRERPRCNVSVEGHSAAYCTRPPCVP